MPHEIQGKPTNVVALYPQADTKPLPANAQIDYVARVFVRSTKGEWTNLRILDGTSAKIEGWVKSASVDVAGLKTVASDTELKQLFEVMRTLTFVAPSKAVLPIPFRYPKDGCYARAEIMAKTLLDRGYTVDKEFAIGKGGLTVRTAHGGDSADWGEALRVDWWYHVAPVVYAADAKPPTPYILDPSVADKPLSIEQWLATMSDEDFPGEVKYDKLRSDLRTSGAYPTDRTVMVRAGASVYAPPSATDPTASVLSGTQDPATKLAEVASLVPAHDVVALLDSFFRKAFAAIGADGGKMRDANVPYGDYGKDLSLVKGKVGLLDKALRQYIVGSFPKFLKDWKATFRDTGIEGTTNQVFDGLTAT
ncbi:protein-glutamine glutaminase family protein [Nocardia sp. NPDC052566]|uniref:protein-glutamine glutaminase family protein n=1 Tax=Nocardia sp. NPDC052566 TaxID=3364330 RepID=UPI0037C8813E